MYLNSVIASYVKFLKCMYKIHIWFCWLNTFSIVLQFFNIYIGSGEVARQLRALGALEKDLSSVPSTHRVAHNFL